MVFGGAILVLLAIVFLYFKELYRIHISEV